MNMLLNTNSAKNTPIVRANSPVVYLTYEQWVELFRPVECDISHGKDGYDGCLYPRTAFAAREENLYNPRKVWTLMQFGERKVIIEGFRQVPSRLGYFITDEAAGALVRYEVEV